MPWMVACLLPLVSMALILTSFGSESHVLLAKVPLAIRLVLLVIALALPFIAACTVDWHLATQPHAPLPSKLFFILACLFVFSTITTFFDALQGLERNTISGGQGWLAFVACLKHLAVTHPESFPLDVDAVPLQCRLVSFEVRPDYQIFDEQCISTILSSSMDTLTHLSIIDEVDEASSDLVCYFQSSLPALSTLKVETFDGYSFAAIGVSEAPNLESLSFGELHDFTSFEDEDIDELLRVIRLPSLQRLRHLRFRTIPKSAFEGTAGLTLLKECEERSITFESSEGSLTYRDLEEDWLS
ncbi:hypothetical protein RQP46_003374 [Phenoliferia psychrophenolica]